MMISTTEINWEMAEVDALGFEGVGIGPAGEEVEGAWGRV